MIGCILSIIGWYIAARALYGLYRIVEEIYLLKELNLAERYGKGSWAFVTGSTDGIGLEFAIQLAKRGFNIIMVARNKQKMIEKEELLKKVNPQVQVEKVVIDFADSADVSKLEAVVNQVQDKDISIVVNNVGVGTKGTPVLDMEMQTALDMVVLNCIPQTIFNRLLVPKLQSRNLRSGIIDLSSITSLFPLPGKEIYAASKSYNRFLTCGLSMLKSSDKVDFLCLKPGFVTTPLTDFRKEDFITCNTEECVVGALKALGQKRETYGATKHILFGAGIEALLFLLPFPLLMKYKDTLYGLIGYKAFTNAKVAK